MLHKDEGTELITGNKVKMNRKGVIILVVCAIAVVALALGLGLGLGLKKNDSPPEPLVPPQTKSCYDALQYKDTINYNDAVPWNRTCPTPQAPQCPGGISSPLILISMDGFRADYMDRNVTPTLSRLAECGVSANHMRTIYPSKTFPGHYTIVTGLFPESHGIIANKMYDMKLNEDFRIGSANSLKSHWWGGEPIWNTVEKAGRTSVTMFWPGSEAPVQDIRPSHCYKYNEGISFKERVNELMGYFSTEPSQFPSLVTFYMHEPDGVGHDGGPFGEYVDGNLTQVDHIVQLLMSGFQQKGLHHCINIMLVSDHGMDSIDCDRTVDLLPYFGSMYDDLYVYDGDEVRITSQYINLANGAYQLVPNGASADDILDRVRCTDYNSTKDWYVRLDKKQDLPKRLHYSNNIRIEEVVGEVQTQWLVYKDADSVPWYYCHGGAHGYDPLVNAMHAVFIGAGPGFKSGYEKEHGFDSVELYNIMADLLNLGTRALTNGTYGAMHDLLSAPAALTPTVPAGSYGSCPYPGTDNERDTRRNYTTTCIWKDIKNFTSTNIDFLDEQLNLDVSSGNISIADHLPLGVPLPDFADAHLCQLVQKDYVMGYSHQHHMPLWSAFKLRADTSCKMPDRDCYHSDDALSGIIRADVRLSTSELTECDNYINSSLKIQPQFLMPPSLINTTTNADQVFDGHISTNIVPMYDGFRTGVWQEVLYLLEEYAYKYGELWVTAGPIFDYNADGRRDTMKDIKEFLHGVIPLPTHYYVIASRCADHTCAEEHLLSIILPHKPHPSNCWDRRYIDYISKNIARVRDIELLTDLRFHTSLTELNRLRLSIALTETWTRLGWMDLTGTGGEQCPTLGSAQCPALYNASHPPLLLISIDGFRPDYADRDLTPTITKLRDCGASTDYMRSIYPTMTFPNHFTITSGLYPESHGIVDNNMYDMDMKKDFWLGSPNMVNPDWWNGEPLWSTVEKNNKTSMTLFWPGSDVEIGGMRPTAWFPYNGDMPYDLRVSTLLDWFEHGSKGKMPDLIVTYFSNVDHIGHEAGPNSRMLSEALVAMDGTIQSLIDGIYRQGLHQCINIIIVSDHGMTDISCDWNVILNDYIDMKALDNKMHLYYGSAARMSNKYYRDSKYNYFHLAEADQVPKEAIINNLTCDISNMNVFDKVDLPKRHHYTNNDRIDDIVFVAAESWLVQDFSPWCQILGQHGWDPYFQNMQAYFAGYGPSFKEKIKVEPFENIELYNLMTHILQIPPSMNNGTDGSLHHLLKNPPPVPTTPSTQYTDCLYAVNDTEYNSRANLASAMCSCNSSTIRDLDERLNFDPSEANNIKLLHVPHGLPLVQDDTVCVLHHVNFVTGFDHDRKVPLWTAFTLRAGQGTTEPQPSCLRPDVRMEQDQQASCADYQMAAPDMTNGFLFPPAWSNNVTEQMDTLILSNAVPMYTSFWNGIWQRMLSRLSQWAAIYTNIHIITGPVYDHDADGRADTEFTWFINNSVPIPSHYYIIALRCNVSDCTTDMNYKALSFILPHRPNITNCATEHQYLLDNVARIRDIELLTGVEFLTAVQSLEGIRVRTFVPTELWDTGR